MMNRFITVLERSKKITSLQLLISSFYILFNDFHDKFKVAQQMQMELKR
jgi:hypothetical protein